jgi:serine/threonine protein kinase
VPEIIAGKYEVQQTIGRGGMGTVYKAVQRSLDRVVAIKMLSEELASDPEFRARFQQEATVVARLSHPNIVAVYDIEPHNHTFCIIMEYLEGENLQAKIDRDVTLPERDVVLIGAQVARALGYAHSQGIIHRDVKPDNVHVTPKGVAKVMDFGIARFLDSKLKTQTGISMGTPKFMSPEQVTGKNVDGQTDLYSLGVCLYYCLAGRPPFDGENAIAVATRHLYEQPEPPSRFNTSISPAVEKVIMRALEKQKAERYSTGFDMADALEGTLGIKSPIRIADETASGVYAGATQKIAVQAMGGGSTAELALTEPADTTPTDDVLASTDRNRSPRGPGWSNVTPVPMRSVAGEFGDFSAPGSTPAVTDPAQDPAQALRKWWPILAAMVVVLGIIAAWVAFGRGADATRQEHTGRPSAVSASIEKEYETLAQETQRLESQRRYMEARQKWVDFQRTHPDYERERVEQNIDVLTGRLPVSESKLLAARRQQRGNMLARSNQPLAMAYLEAALELDPQIKLVDVVLKQVQPLVAKSIETRSQVERDTAASALRAGHQASQGGTTNDPQKAEEAFLQAVNTEPENPVNWLALGDFYADARQQRIDDARVAYGAAAKYAEPRPEAAELKRQANNKRAALNQ